MPKPLGTVKRRLSRTLAQALGAEITDLRVQKRLNQGELAYRLGYNETYVRRLERGTANPSLEVLCTISEFFQLSVSVLISRAQERSTLARSQEAQGHPMPPQ